MCAPCAFSAPSFCFFFSPPSPAFWSFSRPGRQGHSEVTNIKLTSHTCTCLPRAVESPDIRFQGGRVTVSQRLSAAGHRDEVSIWEVNTPNVTFYPRRPRQYKKGFRDAIPSRLEPRTQSWYQTWPQVSGDSDHLGRGRTGVHGHLHKPAATSPRRKPKYSSLG